MTDDAHDPGRPFAEGDLCLLIDPKQHRRIMRLDVPQHFHHKRTGRIGHTDIIGRAQFYDWEQFARLSRLRPEIRCEWFKPFVELKHQSCRACGGQLVLLTGKRQPTLCRQCQADRILRHEERFLRLAKEAAQGRRGQHL